MQLNVAIKTGHARIGILLMNNSISLLKNMPVFGGLTSTSLEFILQNSQSLHIEQAATVFEEGDVAETFYVIQSGSAWAEKLWKEETIPLRRMDKGDCFGEMAIVDLQARSATVRAETDLDLIEISRRVLLQLYQKDLEQFAIIMMNMGREISRRLRLVSDRLFELDQTTAF